MNILNKILIIFYVSPMLVMMYGAIIKSMKKRIEYKKEDSLGRMLQFIVMFIPYINIIGALGVVMSEQTMKGYRKECNKMFMCYECKMLQRRYQQGIMIYDKEKKEYEKGGCIHCDSKILIREAELDGENDIFLAKKINYLDALMSIVKSSKVIGKKIKIEEKQKITNKKMDILMINDGQIEAYQKLQQKKVDKYVKKLEHYKERG